MLKILQRSGRISELSSKLIACSRIQGGGSFLLSTEAGENLTKLPDEYI
jgi:hypothetical protein